MKKTIITLMLALLAVSCQKDWTFPRNRDLQGRWNAESADFSEFYLLFGKDILYIAKPSVDSFVYELKRGYLYLTLKNDIWNSGTGKCEILISSDKKKLSVSGLIPTPQDAINGHPRTSILIFKKTY
jgi:hypothetical protein